MVLKRCDGLKKVSDGLGKVSFVLGKMSDGLVPRALPADMDIPNQGI